MQAVLSSTEKLVGAGFGEISKNRQARKTPRLVGKRENNNPLILLIIIVQGLCYSKYLLI